MQDSDDSQKAKDNNAIPKTASGEEAQERSSLQNPVSRL